MYLNRKIEDILQTNVQDEELREFLIELIKRELLNIEIRGDNHYSSSLYRICKNRIEDKFNK